MEKNASADGVKVILPPEPVYPAFAENNVPVFLGCDDRFFPHAAAVIASIMAHADPRHNYDLFVVQDGVPEARLAAAAGWMRRHPNASLRFVDIRPLFASAGEGAFKTTRALSRAMYFRIFAPEIFSGYDKIVYLDADVVALGDVAGFYNADLRGNLVGGCHDYVAEEQSRADAKVGAFWREQLGMEPGESYFNTGCLALNLAGMRADGAIRSFLEKNREIRGTNLPDQDIMNSATRGRVEFLDCAWNYFDWWLDPDESSQYFALMNERDRETVRNARDRAKVLHFVEKKPWTRDYGGVNARRYWEYAKMTPFYAESLARLKAECALWPFMKRKLLLSAQQANFRLRSLFGGAGGRKRYGARLHNLSLRKRGMVRQRRLVRELENERQKPA